MEGTPMALSLRALWVPQHASLGQGLQECARKVDLRKQPFRWNLQTPPLKASKAGWPKRSRVRRPRLCGVQQSGTSPARSLKRGRNGRPERDPCWQVAEVAAHGLESIEDRGGPGGRALP